MAIFCGWKTIYGKVIGTYGVNPAKLVQDDVLTA